MTDKTSSASTENFSSQIISVHNGKKNSSNQEYIVDKVYNPYEHRQLEHPNSFLGALVHLVKASLGTGILSVPGAYKKSGLLVGIFGSMFVGLLCTHTVYILVQASQKVTSRAHIPSLGFSETAKEVFKQGPRPLRKWAGFAKLFVELALVSTHYLTVSVYMVFISVSLTKLFSYYYPDTESWDRYIFKLIIAALLMVFTQIRELKHMVPFSFIANVMLFVAFHVTGYYIISGFDPNRPDVKLVKGLSGFPSVFSTLLFAMEGIGAIMPIENSMSRPIFLGYFGVLNSAMMIIVFIFSLMGSFGYYRYGDDTKVTITMNLPDDEILAQVAQAAITISVLFTFTLHFYVPTNIIWNRIKEKIPKERHNLSQILLRIILMLIVTAIAIIGGENLELLISLVGAIFFSILGLLIPSVLDIVVNWEDGIDPYNLKLIKNILVIFLSLFALVSGVYYSILNIV